MNEKKLIKKSIYFSADINANLIRYVLSNTTSEVTRDSFMFNVRDSLPNVVTGNTFNIRWSVISFDKSNYTVSTDDIPLAVGVELAIQ